MTQFIWKKDAEITAADIPESAAEIIFSDDFNQPIGKNVLPSSLKTSKLGCTLINRYILMFYRTL